MKLILDFPNDGSIKFVCDDDLNTYYLLINKEYFRYDLWYLSCEKTEKVFEDYYFSSTGEAVAHIVKFLVDEMKVKE